MYYRARKNEHIYKHLACPTLIRGNDKSLVFAFTTTPATFCYFVIIRWTQASFSDHCLFVHALLQGT
jgi:type IV secretory pathway TrbD component